MNMRVTTTLLLLAAAAPAAAQQPVTALLPDTAAERIVAFYNSPATTRLGGDAQIGAGTAMRGGVAALGGTLTIDGVVEGDVIVINGDLVMRGLARVSGTVTVTGGETRIAETAHVAGAVHVYREPLRYRQGEEGIAYVPVAEEPGLSAGRDFAFGRTDLLVATHGAYNRVEGLPLAVGPRIRFGGTHPTTARALIIARSAVAAELDPNRFGFDLRAEQLVAPAAGVTVGARLYSEIAPIESWGLADLEAALSAFMLRYDHRDYYEREGWSVYARLARPGSSYGAELEYRDEEHAARAPADPLTLFHRDRPWRPQPGIAEGALRTLGARFSYDTRNEPRDPSTGWLIRIDAEQGLGGSLVNEAAWDPELLAVLSRPARTDFRSVVLDVRRYARLSPYARLGVRVLGAASADVRALPPQRQHALGGEGSLPGYRLFEFDCGARERTVPLRGDPFHPYYGCDQLALVQLEYQAGFPFARRIAESIGIAGTFGQLVRWVAFFDAGRAWTEPGARDGRSGGDDDFAADAGLGLRLGPLGAYWAVPLTGSGHGFNFFIRLGPRI